MKPVLRISFIDGTVRSVPLVASDIVAFERKFELPLDKIERFEHLCFLAHHAEFRTKNTVQELDTWLELVDGVDFDDSPKGS